MSRVMKSIAISAFALTAAMAALYFRFNEGIYLTLAITFGTVFYHFGIRLFIGLLYNIIMNNRADYTKRWYRVSAWETRLYEFLRVREWKKRIPTYNPDNFSLKKHTLNEIAQVMCQAELVHETNILFSFLPVMASKWFGAFYVFLITSVGGALFDLLFVIVQRYNRPRVIKVLSRISSSRQNAPTQ